MRCLYEVLELSQEASEEDVRKAYRTQALKWHPDKNRERREEAEARFKEISNAFEVLSDRHERQWYDDHREAILRSGTTHQAGDAHAADKRFDGFGVEEIYALFSGSSFSGYHTGPKGFYTVFGDAFDRIAQNERRHGQTRDGRELDQFPLFGADAATASDVAQFYAFWTNFVTSMDFVFVDAYNPSSAPNRRTRRAMEDENVKLRKAAKKEYVEAVRHLATFAKKRDVRVLKYQKEEAERKAEIRAKEERRRQEEEEERRQRAAAYRDADWVTENEVVEESEESEVSEREALWCVICDKIFKSDRALQNHERSKKHRENLAALERALAEEASSEGAHDAGEGVEDQAKSAEEDASELADDAVASKLAQLGVKGEESAGGDHVEEGPPEQTPPRPKQKKGRRSKGTKKRNDEAQPDAAAALTCATCGTVFPSRNQLFKHIARANHAVLRSV